MLTNKEMCIAFVKGSTKGVRNGSMSISTDGTKLLSYFTTIAERVGDTIIVNSTKYSVTTSRQQNLLRKELSGYNVKVTTKFVPRGTQRLSEML